MQKNYTTPIKIIFCITILTVLFGCSGLKNFPGYLMGTYVNQPKEGEEGWYGKSFNYSYIESFEKVEDALMDMGVKIRYKNIKEKTILAWFFDKIYDSCIDTTKVTISFKEIDPNRTEVSVACGNYGLAKFTSEEIYSRLKK